MKRIVKPNQTDIIVPDTEDIEPFYVKGNDVNLKAKGWFHGTNVHFNKFKPGSTLTASHGAAIAMAQTAGHPACSFCGKIVPLSKEFRQVIKVDVNERALIEVRPPKWEYEGLSFVFEDLEMDPKTALKSMELLDVKGCILRDVDDEFVGKQDAIVIRDPSIAKIQKRTYVFAMDIEGVAEEIMAKARLAAGAELERSMMEFSIEWRLYNRRDPKKHTPPTRIRPKVRELV